MYENKTVTEAIKVIITSLISSKKEGEYWDFKEYCHENNADLLHDILCMANNLTEKDGYIIFGVQDKTFNIVGIEKDKNRRNQNYYINFLKDRKFASGVRPEIEFYPLQFDNHEVDVLVIKNTEKTPYYLTEDYKELGRIVRGCYIYTRVGDSNTDINKSADINHVEQLWAKRLRATKKTPNLLLRINDSNNDNDGELSYEYEAPCGLIYARPLDENDIIDGVTAEDISNYNCKLPSQKEIESYNQQLELFENAHKNCHSFSLKIENNGKAKASNIYIDLCFPSAVLVYDDYDVEKLRQPQKPKIPENPIHKIWEEQDRKKYSNLFFSPAIRFAEEITKSVAYPVYPNPNISHTITNLLNGSQDFYINKDHDELTVHVDTLLHTRLYNSDKFCVIFSKQGIFKIKYSIICEELDKPISGEIEITVA